MKLIIQFGIHISTHGRATQILSEIGLGLVTGLGVAGVCCNSIRCVLLFISPIIIEIKLSCLEYHHQVARCQIPLNLKYLMCRSSDILNNN